MKLKDYLLQELEYEAGVTRKFIDQYPEDMNDFKPHEKSMSMQRLANHVVEIFGWPGFILNTEKLDFEAGDYVPTSYSTRQELQDAVEQAYEQSKQAIENYDEDDFQNNRWKMTMGDHVINDWNKYEAIRHSLSQETHHRAQLGVYYRLNDIPVPGSYGPSADDQNF